jgi:hypothetical protein
MNYPSSIPFAIFCIVLLEVAATSLLGCPSSDPAKDDTAEPADGGSDGQAAGPTCDEQLEQVEAERKRLEAELAACQSPK